MGTTPSRREFIAGAVAVLASTAVPPSVAAPKLTGIDLAAPGTESFTAFWMVVKTEGGEGDRTIFAPVEVVPRLKNARELRVMVGSNSFTVLDGDDAIWHHWMGERSLGAWVTLALEGRRG